MVWAQYKLGWFLLLCLGVLATQPQTAAQTDTIRSVSPEELYGLVNENEGKVVLVNFWASWCPPCLKEFPDIIRLYEDYNSAGLEVIAVSMNAGDEMEDIEEFLGNYEPPFPVYRADSLDEAFYGGVIENWFGEIPVTLIFDSAGRSIHFYKKQLTYEDMVADVAALLP